MSAMDNHKNDFPEETYAPGGNVWMRGLFMLIFLALFGLAETVLLVVAVIQFLWMLFAKEKNDALASFGVSLGKWLHQVAEFQTGARDKKPFPWAGWP